MANNMDITDVVKEGVTAAYFDLEFCNENISHHNIPVAIGVSYRQDGKEIGSYNSLIWCGDDYDLWEEQLERIGYQEEALQESGKSMEEVTDDLFAAHEAYQPKLYISLGKQDEDLLKRFVTKSMEHWEFYDAARFLPRKLSLKYDISLEKYAYICGISFVHEFNPMADARSLADIVYCVLNDATNETRRQEVAEEYEKRIFLAQYKSKQHAYESLQELSQLTPSQQEKMHTHKAYLERNRERYLEYGGE